MNDQFDPSRYYRCFTLDTDEQEAAAKFERVYGAPPQMIVEDRGVLWLGPVPERKEG